MFDVHLSSQYSVLPEYTHPAVLSDLWSPVSPPWTLDIGNWILDILRYCLLLTSFLFLAISTAIRIASFKLDGSATPFPAMSYAVP